MKIVKWAVLVVLVLVIAVGLIIYFNLNGIIKRTVETQATASLSVPTTLGSANLSLFGGSLGLNDLDIGSPKGFSAPQLLTLDDASVKVSYGQLRSDPVRIEHIELKSPKLVVEHAGGKFNIQALMDQIPPSESETLKLIIDNLKVSNAQVVFIPGDIPGLSNLAKEFVIPIPDVDLKNIGTGDGNQNGVAIKQVVMQVVTAMSAKASDSELLPEQLRTLLKLDINQISQQLGKEFDKQVANLTEEVNKRVDEEVTKVKDEAGKALEKGLGDLLKKKDEKKPAE